MRIHWFFLILALGAHGQSLRLPTPNEALLQKGREDQYFVGTVGKPWTSGGFGCVRSEGNQMHEGLDIRCLKRDRRGEPQDPIFATADGVVAYVNRRSGLSNYGNYLILKHQIDGLEIFSLYGHLHSIRQDLQTGSAVKAGETIAVMGRTANTRQGISKDRAHLHFELNFLVNDRFISWHAKHLAGQRNDHGTWNGQNLIAIDPSKALKKAYLNKKSFSLLDMMRDQEELCRVFVKEKQFPWLKRYPQLVHQNPRAQKEGIAGYEISFNFNGLPFRLVPKAPSEVKNNARIQLVSVNESEQKQHGCRHLVTRKSGQWNLTASGLRLVELLVY